LNQNISAAFVVKRLGASREGWLGYFTEYRKVIRLPAGMLYPSQSGSKQPAS